MGRTSVSVLVSAERGERREMEIATTITGRKPATILQFLTVNVTDSASCKEVYAERGGILGEKQICAGGEKGKVVTPHNSSHVTSSSKAPTQAQSKSCICVCPHTTNPQLL